MPEESGKRSLSGFGAGPEYWDKRYKTDPERFEWFGNSVLSPLARLIAEAALGSYDCHFLDVGCGNSLLSQELCRSGYKCVTSIDISKVVIEQMAHKHRGDPCMDWLKMDATMMAFRDASFDVVIDKSCLDTLACTESPLIAVAGYLNEVQRVLRPGGAFVCATFGNPESRLKFFRFGHLEFSVQAKSIGSVYVYLLKKPTESRGAAQSWKDVRSQLQASISRLKG